MNSFPPEELHQQQQVQPPSVLMSLKKEEQMVVPSVGLSSPTGSVAMLSSSCISAVSKGPPNKKRRLLLNKESISSLLSKEEDEEAVPTTAKKQQNQVTWNDDKNTVLLHHDPSEMFPSDYKETDIWYSRSDYQKFLLDRIDTVERLRVDQLGKNQSNGKEEEEEDRSTNESPDDLSTKTTLLSNNNHHCMRGLEPFRNRLTHQDMHSKRKLHKSTIIVEQLRQAMLGIKDPERFRFLVAPQSSLALHQAQQQAVMDEVEAYPFRRKSRRFTMTAIPPPATLLANTLSSNNHNNTNNEMRRQNYAQYHRQSSDMSASWSTNEDATPDERSVTPAYPIPKANMLRFGRSSLDLSKSSSCALRGLSATLEDASKASLFSADIRELQERNARRLMHLYQNPGGGMFLYNNHGPASAFRYNCFGMNGAYGPKTATSESKQTTVSSSRRQSTGGL